MSNEMVPYDNANTGDITPEMAEDAKATAGELGVELRPTMHLCQAKSPEVDAEAPVAQTGDFYVRNVNVNLGKTFDACLIGHRTFWRKSVKKENGERETIWEGDWGSLTAEQQAECEWTGDKNNRKPPVADEVHVCTLVQVKAPGVANTSGAGAFDYYFQGTAREECVKFLRANEAEQRKRVPMYASVWRFTSERKVKDRNSWMAPRISHVINFNSKAPAYKDLKESYEFLKAKRNAQFSRSTATRTTAPSLPASQFDDPAEMADREAEREALAAMDREAAEAMSRDTKAPAPSPDTMITIGLTPDNKKIQRRLGTLDVDELHRALQYHRGIQIDKASVHYEPLQAIIRELELRLDEKGATDDSVPF